jgi:hypothetical protein
MRARELLKGWIGQAAPDENGKDGEDEDPEYAVEASPDDMVYADGLERHKRASVILKPRRALAAYAGMLRYYVFNTIFEYLCGCPDLDFAGLCRAADGPAPRVRAWVNMGGQIVPEFRVDALRDEIGRGLYTDWHEIHRVYDSWAELYPADKLRHAWALAAELEDSAGTPPDRDLLVKEFGRLKKTKTWINAQIYRSRSKDFLDPLRLITYRNKEEMEAVAGSIDDNFFVKRSAAALRSFEKDIERILAIL